MRVLVYSIVGAAISILCVSADSQTAFKNTTDDWSVVSRVNGSNGESLGTVYAAPKATLYIENGKISHGAGKFVAETDEKELLACSVFGDNQIDFVSVEVSALSWNAFGYPLEITLRRPIASYHLKADKSDNIEENNLMADAKYPGFNIVKKSDAVILNEISGKVDRTPEMFVTFPVKSGNITIRKRIGLFIGFNSCKVASPAPSTPTTTTPKPAPKPVSH
jgi:hypothetical protein